MKVLGAALLSAAPLVGAPPAAVPPYASLVHLYDYNASAPLDVREASVTTREDVVVHDLSYASPRGGRVPAYLVVPRGAGPFPALIMQPGSGGRREDSLADVENFAERGVAALVIDSPDVRAGGPTLIRCRASDRVTYIRYVVDLRRAVDLLAGRPEIDAERIAFTGFSYGAIIGGTLAGVEHRIKAFALQSGRGYWSRVLRGVCRGRMSKRRLTAYTISAQPIDAIRYVGHARPSALLFQHGTLDPLAPRRETSLYHRAASSPKSVRWYRSGHNLTPSAFAYRDAWLRARLGF